jgi:AraC-like DNA-binding protein
MQYEYQYSSKRFMKSMDYFYVQPFLDKRERFNHRLRLHNAEAESVLLLLEDMIKENESGHSGYAALIRLKLIELLILLSRFYHSNRYASHAQTPPGEIVARRICGYLERHYNQKISLPSLSNLFNISVRQLNRLFKPRRKRGNFCRKHQCPYTVFR